MADLTLGPNYPAGGSLSVTTAAKRIEVTGDCGFLVATLPIAANLQYSFDESVWHSVSASVVSPVSIWSAPNNMAIARKYVYVRLSSGGPTTQTFEAR